MEPNNAQTSSERKVRNFYDIERIKSIPILDVCSHFGIAVKLQSGNYWCSLRSEDDTPSVQLHVDGSSRWQANTFHDFGSGTHGDNIALVCHVTGLDVQNREHRYIAMQQLAEAFHIEPKGKDARPSGQLTDREYEKIGLYGDMATKNFDFTPLLDDPDRLEEISKKYAMPMNDLKKKHPRMFETLVRVNALPYVQDARNNFYMDIWMNREAIRRSEAAGELVFQRRDFSEDVKIIRDMDNCLSRAIYGTNITMPAIREYDPDKILALMDEGTLRPGLGPKSKGQMERMAKEENTVLWRRSLDLSKFYYNKDSFGDLPFSAYFSNGKAVVVFMATDKEKFRPFFDEMSVSAPAEDRGSNTSLEDRVKDAKNRQQEQAATAEVTKLAPER